MTTKQLHVYTDAGDGTLGSTRRDEIVGLSDVADRLGVRPQTAHSWRHRAKHAEHRDVFPDPDGSISSGQTPWWFWKATIVPWAKRTGRIQT